MRVQLDLPELPEGSPANVVVDGHDIAGAVSALTVVAGGGKPTLLSLDLLVNHVTVEGQVRPVIPAVTWDALLALGWTPPADDTRGV